MAKKQDKGAKKKPATQEELKKAQGGIRTGAGQGGGGHLPPTNSH